MKVRNRLCRTTLQPWGLALLSNRSWRSELGLRQVWHAAPPGTLQHHRRCRPGPRHAQCWCLVSALKDVCGGVVTNPSHVTVNSVPEC